MSEARNINVAKGLGEGKQDESGLYLQENASGQHKMFSN